MSDTKLTKYSVTNTAKGPRFVHDSATGRPVVIDPGRSATVSLSETEYRSVKSRGDFDLGKAAKADPAKNEPAKSGETDPAKSGAETPPPPPAEQNGSDGGENGGQTGENPGGADDTQNGGEGAGDPPSAAYVAHEGLGRWFAYTEKGDKFAPAGEEPKAMKKAEAQTWATDNNVEFRGS